MKTAFFALVALLSAAAGPVGAALVHDYQLNNSLADALGGPALINNGGTLGATGITFSANQGPTLKGFTNQSIYTVALNFEFDVTQRWSKILDFKSRSSDNGLYYFYNHIWNIPGSESAAVAFAPGVRALVVVTRDGSHDDLRQRDPVHPVHR